MSNPVTRTGLIVLTLFASATAAGAEGKIDKLMGVARGVLMDGDEAGHAAALLVLAAHRMPGSLGRDHGIIDRKDGATWIAEQRIDALIHQGLHHHFRSGHLLRRHRLGPRPRSIYEVRAIKKAR